MSDVPDQEDSAPVDAASVLIVDDEALIAAFLEDTLDALGFRACGIAGSAEEAVALARLHRPDIALVDIGLRGTIDGVSLARELKDGLGIAVVFLSGSTNAEVRRSAEAVRPHGFLSKPCTESEIGSMLHSAMRAVRAAPPSSAPPSSGEPGH